MLLFSIFRVVYIFVACKAIVVFLKQYILVAISHKLEHTGQKILFQIAVYRDK